MARLILVFVLSVGLAVWSLTRWDAQAASSRFDMLSVPPSAATGVLSSGFRALTADFLYLRFVSYWGHQLTHGRRFHNLAPMLNLIVDLDPRFRSVYEIGSLALGDAGQPQEAVELLERGMARDPNNWWYPYQAGMTLFFFSEDYLRAAAYFEKASHMPGAPDSATFLVARMYEKGHHAELAAATWQEIHARTADPNIREVARHALERLNQAP